MWFFLLLCVAYIVPATSQGDEIKVILKGGTMDYPCEGHAEVLHKGVWGYVGDLYWNETTEETLCRSTHCGKAESRQDVLRDTDPRKPVWLNEVVCKSDSSDLTKCTHPGWNKSSFRKDSVKKIKCSKKINFSLHPFKCAGAVMYNTSEGDKGYFCGDLKSIEANLLCKSLKCGESQNILQDEWIVLKDFQTLEKRSIDCSGIQNLDNLWQCASSKTSCEKPVSLICAGHKTRRITGNVCSGKLEIKDGSQWKPDENSADLTPSDLCKQIHCGEKGNFTQNNTALECKKQVEVVLMDESKPSRCYGEVHFKVNGRNNRVCGYEWTKENAEVVCKELKCGRAVHHLAKNTNAEGIMDKVKCSGQESSLWQCMAKRSDHDTFSCSSIAYVICAESIDVRLEDGPGKCAGRVELQYEGQWLRVTKKGWTDTYANAVCTRLKCGNEEKTDNPEKFSQGSGSSLTLSCKSSVSAISDCNMTKIERNLNSEENEAVGITCEKHKVVFLENACSGKVGIELANKTGYWLSGSSNTWNNYSANTVCKQMHCGEAVNYTSILRTSADMRKVWPESYSCSSNSASLFECENTQRLSDYNNTFAYVNCSGHISVNLTGECWGYVNVCAGGKCDGVCNATWTKKMSQMLCANLSCGEMVTSGKREQGSVIFKSLHMTEHTTSLNQCNLVQKEDGVSCEKAFIVCKGSVKVKFNVSSSRSKCSGKVEMHHEGQWLPVCRDALKNKDETQKIICGELNCGQPLELVDYIGPRATEHSVISKIVCPNNNLSSCVISTETSRCTLGHLRCSSWGNMELKFSNACSGTVFVHSKEKRSPISSKGWTETASKQLCKDLKCGELKSNKTGEYIADPHWEQNFNCDGVKTPQNIWNCAKDELVTSAQQVMIECQGEPKVTLSEKCYGEVRINNTSVCHSHWKPEYSDLICQEQMCGNAVPGASGFKSLSKDVESYLVSCEKYHHKLGQCNRYEAKCNNVVYVYCSDAVKFSTTEVCGGEIEVSYGKTGKKEFVCPPEDFPDDMKQKLCDELDCKTINIKNRKSVNTQIQFLKVKLNCTEGNMDIKRCVTDGRCRSVPYRITCAGHVPPEIVNDKAPNHTLPIILGLGFLLIVMILIIVFIRIRMVRKAKRPINVSPRMLPGKEVEYESGEYEPVTDKENEMDVFSNDRFRSEAEVITESDVRSASSYDDVDQVAESQPLTSPAVPAGASGDSFFSDGALNQSSDGVTYEVEDPQENYDDIEASPEFIQTKAEVHDVPEPAPESVTVATPGMVQGEEDYLVPGQDR